jgi:membrane-associated phospholipid phosphatase
MLDKTRNTLPFFVTYGILLLLGILFYLFENHGDFVLLMNRTHNPFFNEFFKLVTHGGDWIFYTVILVILLIWRWRFGLIFGLVGIIHGGVSYLLKNLLFKETPRPKIFFEGTDRLRFIEGVENYDFKSFPSGHSMTAFALATFIVLMMNNRKWSWIAIIYAFLVATSRVYILQHFLVDVMAGSLIGMVIALFCFMLFENYMRNTTNKPSSRQDLDMSSIDW